MVLMLLDENNHPTHSLLYKDIMYIDKGHDSPITYIQ